MPDFTHVLLPYALYDPARSQCLQEHRDNSCAKSGTLELSPNTKEVQRTALLPSPQLSSDSRGDHVPLVPLVSTLTFYRKSLSTGLPLPW